MHTFLCFICLEVSVSDYTCCLAALNRDNAYNSLDTVSPTIICSVSRSTHLNCQEEKVEIEIGKRENVFVGHGHHYRRCAIADDW